MNRLGTRLGVGVVVLGAAFLLGPTLLGGTSVGRAGSYGMMGGYGGLGGAFLGPFVPLLVLALLVGGTSVLFQSVDGDGRGPVGHSGDGALEALRSAYARGDISEDEFERRRATLRRDAGEQRDTGVRRDRP